MARRNTKVDVWQHIDMSGTNEECWPWTQAAGAGKGRGKPRPYFTISSRKYLAYRLVYEMVTGETLKKDEIIRHSCNNSMCCNPSHMTKGTHAENMQDMVDDDRHGLPKHVVRRIRVLLSRKTQTHKAIGHLYGVSRSVVTRIANDNIHTHEDDYPSDDDYKET